MSDNLLPNQPEETPEYAYADKWLQRILTYAGLPAGILAVLINQTYLAILCFVWLAVAIGYSFVKQLRKNTAQTLSLDFKQSPQIEFVKPTENNELEKREVLPQLTESKIKIVFDKNNHRYRQITEYGNFFTERIFIGIQNNTDEPINIEVTQLE